MTDEIQEADLTEAQRDELREIEPEVDNLVTWVPPGPASQEFLNDKTATSFFMGPVGGGKTTTMCLKRVHDGAGQGVGKDGWVRDRALILRRTWRTAKGTVVRNWREWFPTNYPGGEWTGGEDRPATHILRFQDNARAGSLNPVKIELETDFKGLDETSLDEILKGAQYSRIVLDEADQFSLDVLETCEERVGRYPKLSSLAEREKRTKQVTGAFNAPDTTNYLHDVLVEKISEHRKLIKQPPGLIVQWTNDGALADYRLNPLAENLGQLDEDYYTIRATTWEPWRVRRFILNEWGYSRQGLPVFHEFFREHLHVAKQVIQPNRAMPLIIGVDGSTGGLRPAAVFLQPDQQGFLNLIETFAPGKGWGPQRFWESVLAIYEAGYRGCPDVEIWIDPAGQYGGDREGGMMSFEETGTAVMGRACRIPFGGSNEIALRIDTINAELRATVSGEARRFRISPHPSNKVIIQGFASAYRYKRRAASASSEWSPLPDKDHPCSDPMDALQYAIGGWRRVTARKLVEDGREQKRGPSSGWNAGRRHDFDVHSV